MANGLNYLADSVNSKNAALTASLPSDNHPFRGNMSGQLFGLPSG